MPLNDEEQEELIQQVTESLRPGLSIKLELDIQTKVCNQHFMNNACGSGDLAVESVLYRKWLEAWFSSILSNLPAVCLTIM